MDTETQRTAGAVPEPLARRGLPTRAGLADAVAVRFRLPGRNDPDPGNRRLAGVAAWAGALGLGGAAVALRVVFTLFQPEGGGWYRPTVVAIGTVGLLATIGAFASIHRRRLPWYMLAVGTAALVAAFIATAAA